MPRNQQVGLNSAKTVKGGFLEAVMPELGIEGCTGVYSGDDNT